MNFIFPWFKKSHIQWSLGQERESSIKIAIISHGHEGRFQLGKIHGNVWDVVIQGACETTPHHTASITLETSFDTCMHWLQQHTYRKETRKISRIGILELRHHTIRQSLQFYRGENCETDNPLNQLIDELGSYFPILIPDE
ncbi:MAG: hypothetical protein JW725_05515 [Candidatus Babeliaceae bacterium]|nr:hypothetical protein [Candidatus Babeliaceae bacterium]